METDRHPATDIIHKKLVNLIDEWLAKGYTLDKIAELCDLSTPLIYGLVKQPGQKGYKGARLTVNTAVKVWTGLGNDLSTLFSCDDEIINDKKDIVKMIDILTIDKQVLELDERISDVVLKRRAITPKKMAQIEKLLAGIREILWQLSDVIIKLKSLC